MTEPCLHCADFSRSRLLRQAAAQAGSGLPTIEPGMPVPAGTGLSRRSFLVRSAGLALSVYGVSSLGPRSFEEGIARAASGTTGPVLVSVFLEGGADSLSLLFPTATANTGACVRRLHCRRRTGYRSPRTSSCATPGIEPWQLHEEVTTLPAVGYTHVDQSHFTSRHYWEEWGDRHDAQDKLAGHYL